MPELTRRRSADAPDECWHVFYDDVRVGTVAFRTGAPHDEDRWGWTCGFIPAAIQRNVRTARQPRSSGLALISRRRGACLCQSANLPISRHGGDQLDWTAEKYRRFDRHERMPTDWKAA